MANRKKARSRSRTTVFVKCALSRHVGFPPPQVAVAVDVNENDRADEGETVRLSRDKLSWEGKLTIPRASANNLVAMVAVLANVGARFQVEFRKGSASGKLLASHSAPLHAAPDAIFLVLED